MEKPKSLRAALEASSTWIRNHPDRVSLFAEDGTLVARDGSTSYEMRYTLTVLLTDFPEDHATLYVPLITWLAVNQRDLLQNHDRDPISFEADILNESTADIAIKLRLTEAVVVTQDPTTGAISATYKPEEPDEYHDVSAWTVEFIKPESAPGYTTPDPEPT